MGKPQPLISYEICTRIVLQHRFLLISGDYSVRSEHALKRVQRMPTAV